MRERNYQNYLNFSLDEPWVREYFGSLLGEETVNLIVDRTVDKKINLNEFKFLSGEKI